MLQKLVDDYNTWNYDPPEDMTPDLTEKLSKLSTTAFDTLRFMFCDKKEMQSPRAGEDFMDWVCSEQRASAIEVLVSWCTELLERNNANRGNLVEHLESDTAKDLVELLKPKVFATSKCDNENAAVWPLVKHVRVGIDGPQILRYITLVDLPGLDDTNQVRVNASYDTMRSCDTLWIVANIQRIISNLAVDSLLMRYGKSYNVMIICTGIDQNVDDDLAEEMGECGQSVGDWTALEHQDLQLSQSVIRLIKALQIHEEKLQKLQDRARSRGEKKGSLEKEEYKGKLHEKIRELSNGLKAEKDAKADLAQRRFTALVDARNAYAERSLREKKQHHLPNGRTLQVFCVSNYHYAALKGQRTIESSRLDAEMTGLPALRRYLLERAAPEILQQMESDLNHKYTFFMRGLSLWTKKYTGNGREDLLSAVESPQGKVKAVLQHYYDGFKEICKDFIESVLLEPREEIVSRAKAVIEAKRSMRAATVKAFVRRDGNWETTIVPKECWNEQLLEAATKLVTKQWEDFMEDFGSLEDRLEQDLKNLVHNITNTVESKCFIQWSERRV